MGLFGKIFEKKECSVCGGEIGLLGNRKLEDGNLCKNCAKKLSPWFSERRHSTVEEIKQQLAYREDNKKKVAQFNTTGSIGERYRLLTDDTHRWLTITQTRNMTEENPDILDFQSVVGCRLDIDESRSELKQEDAEGNEISYNPPRYEYSYYFNIIIAVNHPYFDEIRFRLNPTSVEVIQGVATGVGGSFGRFLDNLAGSGFDPMNSPEYRQYHQMGERFCEEIRRIQKVTSDTQYGQQYTPQTTPQTAPQYDQQYAPQTTPVNGPWVCPACNAQNNSGRFCEYCGTPRK